MANDIISSRKIISIRILPTYTCNIVSMLIIISDRSQYESDGALYQQVGFFSETTTPAVKETSYHNCQCGGGGLHGVTME